MMLIVKGFSYFTDKLESVKASITPSATYSDINHPQDSLSQFYPIFLSELLETESYMRVSSRPFNVMPTST